MYYSHIPFYNIDKVDAVSSFRLAYIRCSVNMGEAWSNIEIFAYAKVKFAVASEVALQ